MFGDGGLTFREFVMREPLPLSTIHDAVLEFLRGRDDAVLFGAQAVNAYVDESRMTQDVDIQSPRAADLAAEIREYLGQKFQIAVREREVAGGQGFRLYQLQKPKNRHLVDIRQADPLPPSQRVQEVLVVTPPELIANKIAALVSRRGQPKSGTDWRDLAILLLTFPALKTNLGEVRDRLEANGAPHSVLTAWTEIVAQEIRPEDDDAGY
ncbi:MAG: hypothetical protein JWN86_754 [Planctomycetota bacterium]|nr:hypothetical protein [Planctomycetota bacterium]